MRIQDVIKMLMKTNDVKNVDMARRIGKSRDSIYQRLNQQTDLTMTVALEMLNALDYEIVVKPTNRGRRPDGEVEVTR